MSQNMTVLTMYSETSRAGKKVKKKDCGKKEGIGDFLSTTLYKTKTMPERAGEEEDGREREEEVKDKILTIII